jgi:hypothetical protein
VRPLVFVTALGVLALSACSNTTTQCSIVNCGGCCDAEGQCRDGTSDDACGAGALNCNTCSGGQVCTDKRCVLPQQVVVDAGTPDAGMPIVAPVETWTWAGFPDSACGNGMPTGIGVNVSTRSTDVLIYLMGGGACWNTLTCAFAATNLSTGYDGTDFNGETARQGPPFNRAEPTNPFKDMSYVFVPYCTGDVHAGDNVMNYPAQGAQLPARTVHHKGGKNLAAFLVRLRDTFPNATRVFLSGSSAGAFGAQLNYEQVAAAFPNAEVHVLADCAQIVNPAGTLLTDWITSWNLKVPPACTGCATDFALFPKYLHDSAPNRRFGLLAYTQDNTLRQFSGYDGATYEQRTLALSASAYDTTQNAKYFIVAGSDHVMLDNLQTIQGPQGVSLRSWVQAFVTGGASWQSVKP